MSFDRLRPILTKHGLSEVGTLAELSTRASRALAGRVKAAGAGGGLSRFGERAARMLFRMADKVKQAHSKGTTGAGISAVPVPQIKEGSPSHFFMIGERIMMGQARPW